MEPQTPVFRRLLAGLFDGLLFLLVFFFLGILFSRAYGGMNDKGFQLSGTPALFLMAATFATYLLSTAFMEALGGFSLGKLMFGLKTVRSDQTPLPLGLSFLRSLLKPFESIGLVGPITIIASKRHQNLSNIVTNTLVVNAPGKGRIAAGIIGFLLLSAGLSLGSLYLMQSPVLTASNPRFTSESDETPLNRPYLPGEQINFHIDLSPVQLDENGNPDLVVVFALKDLEGKPVAEPFTFTHRENPDKLPEPLTVPVRYYITIPLNAAGGAYQMTFEAKDLVQQAQTAGTHPFEIRAPKKGERSGLSIELLSFVTGEKKIPTEGNTFKPGDELKATFSVLGYQTADQNKVKLRLGLEVLDEQKNVLTTQEDLINYEDNLLPEDFYVPMNVSLQTPPDVPEGNYEIRLKLTDDIAGKDIHVSLPFKISNVSP